MSSKNYQEFQDEDETQQQQQNQQQYDSKTTGFNSNPKYQAYKEKQQKRVQDAKKCFTGIGGTRITWGDIFWQLVWLVIFVCMVHYTYTEHDEKWWAGVLMYMAFVLVWESFMHYIMGYGLLDPMDKLFNFDIEKNNAMIVGFMEFDKFDYFSMKNYLSRKVAFNARFKSKMTKHFGSYYYQKLSDEEFLNQAPEIFQLLEGVHTTEDIQEFLGVEANIRESDDTVQYRFFLVPDYTKDTSVLMVKFHHSFADGIGLICTLCCLEEEFDKSKIIEQVPKMSCGTRICLLLCLPICVLMQATKSLCLRPQNNELRNPRPLTGNKHGSFTDTFSLKAVKDKAKANNCSINDIMFAITSISFGEYLKARNDPTESITVVCPFTLRRLPDSPQQLQMQNDFAPVPIFIPIRESFEEALHAVHTYMEKEKKSFNAHGTYWQFQLVCGATPTLVALGLIEFMASRFTMVVSNVAGPRRPIVYDGKKSLDAGFFVPALGKLSTGLSFLSHVDTMKVGFCSDEAYVKNPKELTDLMQKNIEKYILNEH